MIISMLIPFFGACLVLGLAYSITGLLARRFERANKLHKILRFAYYFLIMAGAIGSAFFAYTGLIKYTAYLIFATTAFTFIPPGVDRVLTNAGFYTMASGRAIVTFVSRLARRRRDEDREE